MKPIPYREHLILPADPRLDVLIPHAKKFEHEGQQMVLVPHKLDETQVLKNLGYDVRPPIMVNYDWCGTTPYDAQRITSALIISNKRNYVLNGMGTGKTRSLLFSFDYLRRQSAVGKLIVTAPLSTLRQTWLREVAMVFPHLKAEVLYGTKAQRLKALDREADIYIINHDGVQVIFDALMERTDITMAALDELSVYKNKKTDLWKYANLLISRCDRVSGLTATPMPTAPTDAFGQLKLITPQNCQMHFGRFRDEVMLKISQFTYVARKDAVENVYRRMQPSVRFTRDECYDMPPCQYITREAPLSREQEKLFKQLAEECAADVASGSIKAVNEADRINKLVQVALGTVYDVQRNVCELDCSARLAVLDELITESDSKIIVFTPYKSSLRKLAAHLSKKWTVETISGDVGQTAREHIFTRFMNTPDPHVLVAHPDTMSHGLTLTAASTIVWYGPPTSLETYEQANGRITRAGQRHSQLIAHIVSTRIEQKIVKRLETRATAQGLLLEMFEAQELAGLL